MTEKLTQNAWHLKEAKSCFNKTWDFIDKNDRSESETLEMIHTAHASRYHWGIVGEPINFARGEWQLSRVYAIANRPTAAIYHGNLSLKYCLDHQIGDFDLAFAYEALARAYKVDGKASLSEDYYNKALAAAEDITSKDDKDYFLKDLSTLKD